MNAHNQSPEPNEAAMLRLTSISKAFPGVQALDKAQLEVNAGEVHALLGENGAGKSTLIKVIGGAHQPDEGEIRVDGKLRHFKSPRESEEAGVAVIYQEFNLVPALTARENLFLGRESTRAGFVSGIAEFEQASELFKKMGVNIHPATRCDALSVAQQQIVEIGKALIKDARIIVMDEPSAALSESEVAKLFELIRELKSRGVAIVYVSHRLDEIFEICDRATVMRDGMYIATKRVSDLSRRELIELMVGRKLENEFPQRDVEIGVPVLDATDLQYKDVIHSTSFNVRRGEILGITGLVGAGRTELMRLIFGADRATNGSIRLNGKELKIRSPRDAIRAGICLLTEDRKQQGLVLGHSVRENFGLPNLLDFATFGFLKRRAESRAFAKYVDSIRIKVSSQQQLAKNLSGGNQQKVVLAKWLQRHSHVLIFDEPTRGIDVGAKFEIYQLMNNLVDDGKAIIMISSELPEVLGMSDRILVMREGSIVGEIDDVRSATQEDIMHLAVGAGEETVTESNKREEAVTI